MVMRFIEGFDLNAASSGTTDQYYERKLEDLAGTPGTTTGLFVDSRAAHSASWKFQTPVFASQTTWILHWWMRLDGGASSASQAAGINIKDVTGEQLTLDVRATGGGAGSNLDRYFLDLKRGVTTLATAGPYWADEWHSFQLKVSIDPVNGAYELKVGENGATPATAISDAGPVDTADQGVAGATRFQFSTDNGALNMALDHVVICDDTGAVNNDFLGDILVASALPSAEGDDLDWTASSGGTHYNLVNEAMPNGDVTGTEDPKRVTSDTIGDFDRWHYQDLVTSFALPTGTSVHGVSVETCAAMEASGTLDIRPVFKDTTAALAEGTSFTVNTTVWDVFVQMWDVNPATAATWTLATVDAGQFGVKVQA